MGDVIELAQEVDGLEVFTAAILVGNPFAVPPRIIEIEHRGDGVHAEAVDMKTLAPEKRVGQEENADLMPAIIENEGAPILVRAFAGVFVLEKRGAVEAGESPIVAREVGGYPIDDDADACF